MYLPFREVEETWAQVCLSLPIIYYPPGDLFLPCLTIFIFKYPKYFVTDTMLLFLHNYFFGLGIGCLLESLLFTLWFEFTGLFDEPSLSDEFVLLFLADGCSPSRLNITRWSKNSALGIFSLLVPLYRTCAMVLVNARKVSITERIVLLFCFRLLHSKRVFRYYLSRGRSFICKP